jgi:hypothetical protein
LLRFLEGFPYTTPMGSRQVGMMSEEEPVVVVAVFDGDVGKPADK